MFEEIDSGKEKRRKRLSNKKHERMSTGRKHAKRRRFIRQDLYEDMRYHGGDTLINGDLNREGNNEEKFLEDQDRETEEQEENDKNR